MFFFFKQKTAYEMRISDWSSDVCSSDLPGVAFAAPPLSNQRADAAVLFVVPDTAPQAVETEELIEPLRNDVVPTVLHGSGLEVSVGGVTAIYNDLSDISGQAVAAVHGRRDQALLPPAPRRVPLGARADQGGGHEPVVDRGRLRRDRRCVPGGVAQRADRGRPDRADPVVRADDAVGHPLRDVHGERKSKRQNTSQ